MYDYTFIYSSPCKEALTNLVESFVNTFGLPPTSVDDMFWMGVFCKEETYANYDWKEVAMNTVVDFDVPPIFTLPLSKEYERIDTVRRTMEQVMRGEIEKPRWMNFVEEEATCNEYSTAPSTYLFLVPKEEKYRHLGDMLLNFLYSPNWLITLVKDN